MPRGSWTSGDVFAERSRPPTPTSTRNAPDYNNVLVLLQAEVAANYIQMRAYEERLQLAEKNVELQKETLRIVSLRERSGLVTELDVQRATYALGQTESMIPILETGRRPRKTGCAS